jgi:hypothetical protein
MIRATVARVLRLVLRSICSVNHSRFMPQATSMQDETRQADGVARYVNQR